MTSPYPASTAGSVCAGSDPLKGPSGDRRVHHPATGPEEGSAQDEAPEREEEEKQWTFETAFQPISAAVPRSGACPARRRGVLTSVIFPTDQAQGPVYQA